MHKDFSQRDLAAIADHVAQHVTRSWRIRSVEPMSGGIQPARLIRGSDGPNVFAKKGSDAAAFDRFVAEADGLQRLAQTRSIRTPKVLGVLRVPNGAVLVLRAVETVEPTPATWDQLGREVAALHRHASGAFGLDRNNYIGIETQDNTPDKSWPRFYAERRLRPMLKLAAESSRLTSNDVARVERLIDRVPELAGPPEIPALLHGDLWHANVLFDASGPVLIDPAVFYGHREMEIAFTELFGGFDPAFYRAYDETFPLDEGYPRRRALWQIHSLLLHVHAFGDGYVQALREAVGQYV